MATPEKCHWQGEAEGLEQSRPRRRSFNRVAVTSCFVIVAVALLALTRLVFSVPSGALLDQASLEEDLHGAYGLQALHRGLKPDTHRQVEISKRRHSCRSANSTTSSQIASSTTSSASAASRTVLEVFAVHQPVLTPEGPTLDSDPAPAPSTCTQVIMDHVFAYSYGSPFVGNYTPPSCSFNRVAINFTVVSAGRQFDRLALMYFGDTEVWRTSTAEPTSPPGIRWTYLKDMTEYLYFWRSPQTLIFDLGNLVDSTYTASFNTTLTAIFFTEEVDTGGSPPSDLIIPVSKKQGAVGGASVFIVPGESANTTVSLPRNVKKAVFSVSANGQASEEFWWSNVPQSDVNTFENTTGSLPGYSPWREVQVFIDSELAGVQWAFPVIFTGGVVPSLHRPIVGLDAFDLREHEIDITPWLGLLCDGRSHLFEIKVAGLNDYGPDENGAWQVEVTEAVGDSWYVTGKIFLWLDEDENSITTGDAIPVLSNARPNRSIEQHVTTNGTANETLNFSVEVARSFSASSTIVTQDGSQLATWSQVLTYSNQGYLNNFGFNQINDFLITGIDASSSGYKSQYKYPLYADTSEAISPQGNLTLGAHLIQGLQLYVEGPTVFPSGLEPFSNADTSTRYVASLVNTTKDGTATFSEFGDATFSTGSGSSDQVFTFGGFTATGGGVTSIPDQILYSRHAAYVNNTITVDNEQVFRRGTSNTRAGTSSPAVLNTQATFPKVPSRGGKGPRVFMGRQGT